MLGRLKYLALNSGRHQSSASIVCSFLICFLAGFCFSSSAHANDLEILKQKKCTFLVTPSAGLTVGETLEAQTSSGRRVTLRVRKKSKKNAMLTMRGRDGKCPRISGSFALGGASGGGGGATRKSFYVGVNGNAGLFTFRQQFSPFPTVDADGNETGEQPQPVNGLSGVGFSGGLVFRYMPSFPFGLELGLSALTTSPSGKTVMANNDDYLVSTKLTEVVLQPAASITRCVHKRIYCRAGGVFGIPINPKLNIKSSEVQLETIMKYKRMGGEFVAGFNIASAFTITAGTQVSVVKGSFSFSSEMEEVTLSPLSVYIFGGLLMVF